MAKKRRNRKKKKGRRLASHDTSVVRWLEKKRAHVGATMVAAQLSLQLFCIVFRFLLDRWLELFVAAVDRHAPLHIVAMQALFV